MGAKTCSALEMKTWALPRSTKRGWHLARFFPSCFLIPTLVRQYPNAGHWGSIPGQGWFLFFPTQASTWAGSALMPTAMQLCPASRQSKLTHPLSSTQPSAELLEAKLLHSLLLWEEVVSEGEAAGKSARAREQLKAGNFLPSFLIFLHL